jgi:hypothetical protein
MKTFGSYQEIIAEVKHERDKCKRECYDRVYQLIRSRGTSILLMDENGRLEKHDEPYFINKTNPTLRDLKQFALECRELGGTYIAIDGGFDGVYSIRDNDYSPCIGYWGVDISIDNVLAL